MCLLCISILCYYDFFASMGDFNPTDVHMKLQQHLLANMLKIVFLRRLFIGGFFFVKGCAHIGMVENISVHRFTPTCAQFHKPLSTQFCTSHNNINLM